MHNDRNSIFCFNKKPLPCFYQNKLHHQSKPQIIMAKTKILLAATIAAGIVYAACRKVDRGVPPPEQFSS